MGPSSAKRLLHRAGLSLFCRCMKASVEKSSSSDVANGRHVDDRSTNRSGIRSPYFTTPSGESSLWRIEPFSAQFMDDLFALHSEVCAVVPSLALLIAHRREKSLSECLLADWTIAHGSRRNRTLASFDRGSRIGSKPWQLLGSCGLCFNLAMRFGVNHGRTHV